jgi:hypothetical protein
MIDGTQDAIQGRMKTEIPGKSTTDKATPDDGDGSESMLEVEVVTVKSNPMTPIPRHNSDDSSNGHSDATEAEDKQEIISMCYECNE